MECSINGCAKEIRYKKAQLCNYHYNVEWSNNNPEKAKAMRKRYSKKYYENNKEQVNEYLRKYMASNAKNEVTKEHIDENVLKRFYDKVEKTDTCWNWTGARTANRPKRILADATVGYGVININKRPFYVHRLAWMMAGKDLVEGLVIDHICNNSLCVNPDHLQQITHEKNIKRSEKTTANGAKYYRRFCKYGHERLIEDRGKKCSQCYNTMLQKRRIK